VNESVASETISPEERLARFITSKHWLRAEGTVKPDAFIPPADLNLSVTRHIGLSEEQLLKVGQDVVRKVADKRTAALYGRADFVVKQLPAPLLAAPAPLIGNTNHAHVTGWPSEKPAQKNLAQRLAAVAVYVILK